MLFKVGNNLKAFMFYGCVVILIVGLNHEKIFFFDIEYDLLGNYIIKE